MCETSKWMVCSQLTHTRDGVTKFVKRKEQNSFASVSGNRSNLLALVKGQPVRAHSKNHVQHFSIRHRKHILFHSKLSDWNQFCVLRVCVWVCARECVFFLPFFVAVFFFHPHFVDLSCERVARSWRCTFPYTVFVLKEQKLIGKESFVVHSTQTNTVHFYLSSSHACTLHVILHQQSLSNVESFSKFFAFKQFATAVGSVVCINFVVNKN